MNKHTPGPWSRARDERFRHDNSAGVRAANGLYIAAALDRNSCDLDEEVEANARLIAAAPDLLAACREALENLDRIRQWRQDTADERADDFCRRHLDNASMPQAALDAYRAYEADEEPAAAALRAAIAKAEGGSGAR